MKLKLTPTQNLCVGYLESGFELVQLDEQYYFIKGKRRQKVLPKTLARKSAQIRTYMDAPVPSSRSYSNHSI